MTPVAESRYAETLPATWLAVRMAVDPAYIDAMRRAGELIAVRKPGSSEWRYPAWQFDHGAPRTSVARIVATARSRGIDDARLYDVLTAPLGLIGVTAGLLVFGLPFGFVAMLGTIALGGMIMRNSVILIDQIDQDLASGSTPWEAVVGSTLRRFRPIVLTALAAMLGAVFILDDPIFNGLAISLLFGIFVSTVLTLLVIPVLYYAANYRKMAATATPPLSAQPA